MKDNEPKMAQFLDRLTHREQQIICHQVRTHSGEQRYAHLAPHLLPFVPLSVVFKAFNKTTASRPIAVLMAKLKYDAEFKSDNSVILVDKKVLKMFGPNPERGRVLTWHPKKPVVALKRKHNGTDFGKWQVEVNKNYQTAVLCWLVDTCG